MTDTLTHPHGPATTDSLLRAAHLDPDHVRAVARATLAEDLTWGPDITTSSTVSADAEASGLVVAREAGVLAGVPIAVAVVEELARQHDTEVTVEVLTTDGSPVVRGTEVLRVTGPVRTLLTAERSLLNLLCQLSGVATLTARWVDAVAGTDARIRDTRKTVPGLRILQKYAVRCGGGVNHRLGLGDAALIKDNHIAAAGSVRAAYQAVRAAAPTVPVEVECDTLEQVAEAIAAGADLVLLDNMPPAQLREAVALRRSVEQSQGVTVRFEASGGLELDTAAEVAATGVDFLAVGALTHSAPVLDLGFDLS